MMKRLKTAGLFAAGLGVCSLACATARGDAYSSAVMALNPTHYYQLNETTIGSVTDSGAFPIAGTHEGVGSNAADPEVFLGDGLGQVGVAGPDNVYKYDPVTAILTTIPLPGFSPSNRAIFNNDSLAVNLGNPLVANGFAHTTMTMAAWFKFPNGDMSQPGVVETVFGPGNGGGDRLFTNNFNGQDSPGTSALDTSDVDDLGHFQIDVGGANLIVSIDNNFSDPLKSNYQIVHRDGNDPGVGLAVKDGSWHHIVVSRNGDDIFNTLLVVDGEHITTDRYKDSTDSWGITEPFDARIGTRTTAPHHHTWGGWIDELAIWTGRQLTVEEAIGLWTAATTAPQAGDYDSDSDVDGNDFLVWQRGGSPSPLSPADLATWKTNFGATAVAAAGAVPEPTTMGLACSALVAGLASLRQRGRRRDAVTG